MIGMGSLIRSATKPARHVLWYRYHMETGARNMKEIGKLGKYGVVCFLIGMGRVVQIEEVVLGAYLPTYLGT